jgi:preprotein translocase subunit YajC
MHSRFCGPVTAYAGRSNSLRTRLILLLAAAMLGTPFFPAFAQVTQTQDPAAVERQVKKFGVGKSVKVWLVGGEQVNGHIRKIGDDSFTVKVNKSTERSIPYSQVTEVKDPGPVGWLLIGAAIVIVVILIFHH